MSYGIFWLKQGTQPEIFFLDIQYRYKYVEETRKDDDLKFQSLDVHIILLYINLFQGFFLFQRGEK